MSADEKVITEAAETARRYLDRALLAPLSEFGLLLREKISYWRFKSQVNTILKAKAFLDVKGVDPSTIRDQIDPEIVVPLIETAGTTSTEPLPELFSGWLAASLREDHADFVHKSYIQVLGNLSPLDAHILIALKQIVDREVAAGRTVKKGEKEVAVTHRDLGISPDMVNIKIIDRLTRDQVVLSFENLRRLGLCDRGSNALDHLNQTQRLSLTEYGVAFVIACTKDICELKEKEDD